MSNKLSEKHYWSICVDLSVKVLFSIRRISIGECFLRGSLAGVNSWDGECFIRSWVSLGLALFIFCFGSVFEACFSLLAWIEGPLRLVLVCDYIKLTEDRIQIVHLRMSSKCFWVARYLTQLNISKKVMEIMKTPDTYNFVNTLMTQLFICLIDQCFYYFVFFIHNKIFVRIGFRISYLLNYELLLLWF